MDKPLHVWPDPKISSWQLKSVLGMLALSAALLGGVIWVALQPPILSYANLPLKLEGPTIVKAGDTLAFTITRCNKLKHELIYTVTRGIKNIDTGHVDIFPSVKVSVPAGCTTGTTRLHALPANITPGTYQVTGIGTVRGAFGDIDIPFYSEHFIVKP